MACYRGVDSQTIPSPVTMKTTVILDVTVTNTQVEELSRICPSRNSDGGMCRFELDLEDPSFQRLLDELSILGYTLWDKDKDFELARNYVMTYVRHYNDSDLA